jgi:shikimate kinase/3-dehydroquinate synthase
MPDALPSGLTRIVLVGFMGAGKTTVGRHLAALLGWDFIDLDDRIVARAGRPVAAIFREHGEAAFRAAEHEAAVDLQHHRFVVIAAGGGAFVAPGTRAVLSTGALTVWLRCTLPALLARIANDASRPLAGSYETISALLTEREPLYRLADMAVDTTSVAPPDAAREIANAAMQQEPGSIDR